MSTDTKLSKAQVSKMIQIGGGGGGGEFRIIIKWISRSINKICSSFDKKYYSTLRITAACLNKEMHDLMKIVQALEDSNILFKGVTETIKREAKEEKRGFLGTQVGFLRSILLANLLSRKWIVRTGFGTKKGKEL